MIDYDAAVEQQSTRSSTESFCDDEIELRHVIKAEKVVQCPKVWNQLQWQNWECPHGLSVCNSSCPCLEKPMAHRWQLLVPIGRKFIGRTRWECPHFGHFFSGPALRPDELACASRSMTSRWNGIAEEWDIDSCPCNDLMDPTLFSRSQALSTLHWDHELGPKRMCCEGNVDGTRE